MWEVVCTSIFFFFQSGPSFVIFAFRHILKGPSAERQGQMMAKDGKAQNLSADFSCRVNRSVSHVNRTFWYIIFIISTRPKPADGRQGLAGSWGQDTDEVSTFWVFLTSHFAPAALSSELNQPGTIHDDTNPPGIMKTRPGAITKTWKTNLEPWKTNLGPWKTIKTDLKPWKSNPNHEKPTWNH